MPPLPTRRPASVSQAGNVRMLQSMARVKPGQALVFCVCALALFALALQFGAKEGPDRVELLMSGGA